MKNLMILPLIFIAISFTNAQDSLRVTQEIKNTDRLAHILSTLEHELSITKQQKQQVKQLLEKRFTARDQISKANQSKFKLANENTLNRLQEILTSDQYERYLQLKEEKRQKRAKYLHDHPDYKFSEEDELLDF